jgi:catechol 2,3-dioxygenase-like lactoylglutathione lyase family enzyme
MQLHHLALGATDVAALAGFYASVFGLEQVREHRRDDGTLRSIWLRLGDGLLMVESIESGSPREAGLRLPEAGWFLLAFTTTDEAESERVCNAATARGATESHRTGFTRYLVDPEGNRVAVSHFPIPEEP